MPRRTRVLLPGISLHLIQRGNNRSACFYADEDYLFYLDVLVEQAKKHGCAIHAWCLITNHVHLLVTPESPASAGLMMKGPCSGQPIPDSEPKFFFGHRRR
ncbi:transposase [Pseudomonas berkeleyensis]|uniref:transposase n=1 Tax=Pseudomonas berkeleyensis TaxID=2726956 RepID=UPI001EE21508|nr:transposase [Pseudomonas berkeleyensis]WSO40886.1 transposase [Pseudomonas berkeleyensis]